MGGAARHGFHRARCRGDRCDGGRQRQSAANRVPVCGGAASASGRARNDWLSAAAVKILRSEPSLHMVGLALIPSKETMIRTFKLTWMIHLALLALTATAQVPAQNKSPQDNAIRF